MLPSFYHDFLQKYLTPAQLLTLQMLVWLLQFQKEVRIERLAATLQLPILQSSRRRHIQRFLQIKALSILILWFPIVKEVISRQLKAGSQLVIALDRTQWKEHNVLMVSASIQKRAFPLFWTLLDKKGASNLGEQQQVLHPVIRLLKRYKLIFIGEREFHSIELAQWLHRQHHSFVLRQKCDTTFREKKQPFRLLDTIPVKPGIHIFYPKISFTKKKGFSRFNLVASGQGKYRGQQEDEPWYLLTNLPDLKSAMTLYSKRYGIEAMFKDCKTGGYNLEGCQGSPDKLIALMILIALAMTEAGLQGKRTQLQGQEKYVCRLKEPGRNRRRHSKFWIGLYGENWLIAWECCREWVESMMSLVRNRQSFYQKGLKAIKLIGQPL
jgi:hypothetical protein